MADYPREPRSYELMVILLPELVDEALTATIDRVSGYVTSVGAELREVLQDSPWGRRRLAYTIRFNGTDYRDGYYAIWHFNSIPSALGDLERDLKLDTSVIRHLLVIEDPKWGSPQERDAAREAANAPAEPAETEGAAVANTEGISTDAEAVAVEEAGEVVAAADVIDEVVNVEEAAEVEPVVDATEVAEVSAAPEETAATDATVETPAADAEAEPVVESAEVGDTAETESTEEEK